MICLQNVTTKIHWQLETSGVLYITNYVLTINLFGPMTGCYFSSVPMYHMACLKIGSLELHEFPPRATCCIYVKLGMGTNDVRCCKCFDSNGVEDT